MTLKAAVIAGTPVDTKMGIDYLNKCNEQAGKALTEPFYYPVSESCEAQIQFQYKNTREKKARLSQIFDDAQTHGINDFFIYCNSLSAAFDFDAFAAERGVNVYTPLQVYRETAESYKHCIGVMAANNLSAHKIEEVIMQVNPSLYVIGVSTMQTVSAIEAGLSPKEIIEQCALKELVCFFEKNKCECLILGCTHFPYFKNELMSMTSLKIVDPADEMFARMIG